METISCMYLLNPKAILHLRNERLRSKPQAAKTVGRRDMAENGHLEWNGDWSPWQPHSMALIGEQTWGFLAALGVGLGRWGAIFLFTLISVMPIMVRWKRFHCHTRSCTGGGSQPVSVRSLAPMAPKRVLK